MAQYKAPLRDMQFVLHDMLNIENHYASIPAFADTNRELVDSVLEAGAQFCENELSPINRSGDEEGCQYNDGEVSTPKGFKEAYKKYVELGFGSLSAPVEHGGQGLPPSLGVVMSEMMGTANWSWGMYPGLSHGAINTVEAHGSAEQKEVYLTKLISGEWTGTMCLTESHAGSDLGLIRTKAEPQADGSYKISGTKIFISAGEHDMADNIVHIVLARLPDAPKGTKGISLFIVPKFMPTGERNGVKCGSIEHKMGIKASATCVMNFDGATGFLIGPPNKGLNCMFTFMNTARIGTAVQGVAAAEGSFQGALEYARDRTAMRSLTGPKNPEKEADVIIVHPAVRQLLLTQKAFAEGGRAMVYLLSSYNDIVATTQDAEAKKAADDMMSLLTPIAKAFLTEVGYEAANHGVQVFGGHGFIREWGMEQYVRDTRIAQIYEGTNGVQAQDLMGRKVAKNNGVFVASFIAEIRDFNATLAGDANLAFIHNALEQAAKEIEVATQWVIEQANRNPDEINAAAVDYLHAFGLLCYAYMWAKMSKAAVGKDDVFYADKLRLAQFFTTRMLPELTSRLASLKSGSDAVMNFEMSYF